MLANVQAIEKRALNEVLFNLKMHVFVEFNLG